MHGGFSIQNSALDDEMYPDANNTMANALEAGE
jgi:hypothetical protein